MTADLAALRAEVYERRREAARLRESVFVGPAPAGSVAELAAAEQALVEAERRRSEAELGIADRAGILAVERAGDVLGEDSTGLVATLSVRLAQVPLSIYHLLTADSDPLVQGTIDNRSEAAIRRVRVTTTIDGYSAASVETFEVTKAKPVEVRHLPTLFPDRIRGVREITRATVTVLVEDIGGPDGTSPPDQPVIELHRSQPVWLLARTSVPFMVRDPVTQDWRDLTKYFGAFVTPNSPPVMAFLRKAAARHPKGQLVGYQVDAAGVEAQVKAIYEALREDAGIAYVNSVIAFSPEDDATATQRVRLPADSLKDGEANCIDGVVLMASLIEAASMNAAIVVIRGHAFLAWQPRANAKEWDYVETTMLGTDPFEAACERARTLAKTLEPAAEATNDRSIFQRLPIRELRAQGITPVQ